MANISYNELTYANKKYTIFANIFNINGKLINDINIRQNIPLSTISRLELNSTLTSPIFSGKFEFVVKDYNPFQLILRELYSYLELDITEYSTAEYTNNTEISVKPRVSFNHTFLITKVEMQHVKKNYIKYNLNFISTDIWNIENKIYLATAGQKRPIIELMSEAFSTAGLNLNIEAIKKYSIGNGTNKSISYTSTANDNLNSIIVYLQKQLVNPSSTTSDSPINCESLVSYIYNHITNTYHLWNLDCIYHALLSANQEYIENNKILDGVIIPLSYIPYISEVDPNIEISQYPSISRLNTAKALASYNTYSFDFSKNLFTPITIENSQKQTIVESQWISNSFSDTFTEKYKPISYKNYPQWQTNTPSLDLVIDSYHSPSDSHQSIYKDLMNILLGNDTLLVKTTCKIDRFPGNILNIIIEETGTELKYDGFENETPIQFDTRTKWRKLQTLNGFYTLVGNSMVFEYDEITNTPMFRNYLYLNRPVNIK